MSHWRVILARLPLPMLALAASYGVFSFAQLFVPLGVAIIQAAAFELTYIGLAVTQDLSDGARKRATAISVGAVVASIVYNTLAGWFHRQPQLLESASPIAWLMFAILHGAPLAWVAYLVADLLLHSTAQTSLEALPERLSASEAPDQGTQAAPVRSGQAQAVLTDLPSGALAGSSAPLDMPDQALEPPRPTQAVLAVPVFESIQDFQADIIRRMKEAQFPDVPPDQIAVVETIRYSCPHCGSELKSKQARGAAVSNGYCLACKPERKAA